MDERMDFLVFADIQKAHAFRAVKLVCACHQGIHRKLGQVMGIMYHGLHSIGVKKRLVCSCQAADSLQVI